MSLSGGISPGAGSKVPGPLGSGKAQATGRDGHHSSSSGGATDPSHEHHWRLWQPGKKDDLGFFEGSIREMQAIVMVPGEDREVRRFGAGQNHSCYLDNELVASASSPHGGRFSVHAGLPGETVLHVESDHGKCRSGLFIHVRRKVTLRVHFLVLEDGEGLRAKGYSVTQRKSIIETINEIYLPQLGVQVVDAAPGIEASDPSRLIPIDMPLGDTVNFALMASATVQSKITKKMPQAMGNPEPKFIFTRKWSEEATEGLTIVNRLFIRDGLKPDRVGRVCAHELAHLLTSGIPGEFDSSGHTVVADHLLNVTGSGVRLDPFATSLAMYRKSLEIGGTFD